MDIERKYCDITELKFAESETMSFEGYGAVFGNIDSHGDVIQPGAFAESLASSQESGNWPAMLLQHGGWQMSAEDMTPIGVWSDLSEDGTGLKVKGQLAQTPRGQEIYTLLKMQPRPAINGLSIGYRVKSFERRTKPEEPRRTLTKLDLVEISPVTFPANGKARIHAVKSIDEITSLADVEEVLRDVGFSVKEAKRLIAMVKGADLRDVDGPNELANILKSNALIFGGL